MNYLVNPSFSSGLILNIGEGSRAAVEKKEGKNNGGNNTVNTEGCKIMVPNISQEEFD